VQEWGKRVKSANEITPLPKIEHKTGDKVVLTIDSMKRDGVGMDCQGVIEVVDESK